MTARRHFLFLQGNACHFYRQLGAALAESGHAVTRVNVCGGDWLFWGDWNACDFRDRPGAFSGFLDDLLERKEVTDMVFFNDCRPIHQTALTAARRRGLRVHVFEEGYLRPHWITLERGGTNGHSRLPDDPLWYRETARRLPPAPPVQPVGSGMRERALHDFQWQVANYRYVYRYPHYRTHRPYPIWAEYATWARRLATLPLRRRQAEETVRRLITARRPFYLFPLQLDTDSQIRVHSPFGRLPPAIKHVIESFAVAAPADALLVIKNHPLDNGWINYRRLVRRWARACGVAERVLFIDGGDLNALLDHARGTVTVNSTVGLTALARGAAVMALGKAIFDIPGLTFQGPLEAFWHNTEPPDRALLDDFQAVLQATCLINGNFYTDEGARLAVANSLRRLTVQEDLLAEAPQRRDRSEGMKVQDDQQCAAIGMGSEPSSEAGGRASYRK